MDSSNSGVFNYIKELVLSAGAVWNTMLEYYLFAGIYKMEYTLEPYPLCMEYLAWIL